MKLYLGSRWIRSLDLTYSPGAITLLLPFLRAFMRNRQGMVSSGALSVSLAAIGTTKAVDRLRASQGLSPTLRTLIDLIESNILGCLLGLLKPVIELWIQVPA